ncbi:MAG: single-stranded DNA-binding protein [Gemmatimonadaceae bacterium]
MNKAILIGNLGDDPELRSTQSGTAVLNLRMATTESYLDRDGARKERTDWHNVTIWGKRGEALAKILAKGSRVCIEGRIQTSSYDGKDGTKRYKTEINATNVLLLGGPRGAPADEDRQRDDRGRDDDRRPAPRDDRDDRRPRDDDRRPPPRRDDRRDRRPAPRDDFAPPLDDADLPF